MTYFQFIHAVEDKVKESTAGDFSIYVHSAVKNNGTKRHGLTIAEKGINIFPTIYLEEYYRKFQNGISVERIAKEILNLYGEVRFRHSFESEFLKDYQKIKDKIVYHLVNRRANKDLLEEVPYEEYLDLAVIYYVLLEVNPYGMASLMIRDEHLEMWNVTAKEVAVKAHRNTRRLLPYEFSYGAAAILYENQLEGIGAYLEENYYVLPSSIHEVIIVPESVVPGRKELDLLVADVNETQVDAEERLSDHAYYYDCQKRRLNC